MISGRKEFAFCCRSCRTRCRASGVIFRASNSRMLCTIAAQAPAPSGLGREGGVRSERGVDGMVGGVTGCGAGEVVRRIGL